MGYPSAMGSIETLVEPVGCPTRLPTQPFLSFGRYSRSEARWVAPVARRFSPTTALLVITMFELSSIDWYSVLQTTAQLLTIVLLIIKLHQRLQDKE
jgi:hypothetical protein